MITTIALASIYGYKPIAIGTISAQTTVILMAVFLGKYLTDNMS